jgi:hypothetical protein
LINPKCQSPHRRWVNEACQALADVELPYLGALVTTQGYIPDFLTPPPRTNRANIEADLGDLLATRDDRIRDGAFTLIEEDGDSEIRQYFVVNPREAVGRLVEELRLYWQRTLAHYWPRMVSILEGDILYRGRLLALDGPDGLLPDLHPSITYQPYQIHLAPVCHYRPRHHEFNLAGDGIQLVPTIFTCCGHMLQVTPERRPMIVYSARGGGLYGQETRASKPLELTLGASQARVLNGLRIPATTGEMAQRLSLTSGGVSQHLQRLARAGLVEPHRSGKRVYYQLTRWGEELIAIFERMN